MNTVLLNDSNEIPTIGFGTYKAKGQDGIDSVNKALEAGYRLIDTAAIYENEKEVGQGIKLSGIPRNEIFITSKVWRGELGYESTKIALDESLKRLQVDYLDLYLIHWPANASSHKDWQKVNAETWRAMEECQKEGKIRSIGVSNFWKEHLDALLETSEVIPAVNQIEFHPGYWQPEVYHYCQNKGILIEAWAPLAKGDVLHNDIIQNLSSKYEKTKAQICLRWAIDHGTIPIPKSTTSERISENFDVFDFELSEADIEVIDRLPQMGFSGHLPNKW